MSIPSDTSPRDLFDDSQPAAAAALAETRPFYWSVRRELWENRSIYLAPLAVAAVVFLALSISALGLPQKMRVLEAAPPAHRQSLIAMSYNMAPAPIMLATFLVGLFYSIDALYGERRDRSILFWKSLPVSDLTTVLSKASIPLLVLPLIAFVLSVATKSILALLGIAVLLASGMSPATFWAGLRFLPEVVVMFYGLAVHALWFAPIYCWLLLLSGWARRVPLLWAVLPPLAISAAEHFMFKTSDVRGLLLYRVIGAMAEAFKTTNGNIGDLSKLTPVRFLSTPGLWGGLIFAAACLAAAVRLRRRREPI